MGRTRIYWNDIIRKLLKNYPNQLKSENTIQSVLAVRAIDKAISETEELPDGSNRMKFIRTVYFDNCKTIKFEAQADFQGVGVRTAVRWVQDFVEIVANELGYT